MRVVVAALQLQAGFEDFRGDVYGRGGEVGYEAWKLLAHIIAYRREGT
jgi:hypothetical protein